MGLESRFSVFNSLKVFDVKIGIGNRQQIKVTVEHF